MTLSLRCLTHHQTTHRALLVAMAGLTAAIVGGTPVSQAAPLDPGSPSVGQAVSIAAFAFAPSELSVPAGATVTWTNTQDGVPHTSTSPDSVWDSGVLSTSTSFSFTFSDAGDFAYQCSIHPNMHGIVHVVPNVDASPAAS